MHILCLSCVHAYLCLCSNITVRKSNLHLQQNSCVSRMRCFLQQMKDQFNMSQHPEDTYNLNLLYFAHFVVLGKENESAIDYHLLQLVDDEEKWETYPS
ncbi:hypothetical protein ACFX2J_025342 [Malus domestica]